MIEKIENMSAAETKNFSHQFLDNYILGNEDIVRLLYEFWYHNSKAFQNQNNDFTARFTAEWDTWVRVIDPIVLSHSQICYCICKGNCEATYWLMETIYYYYYYFHFFCV